MHIININLHNSKTLWFSVLKFRQHVRIDLLYVRAKFQNFSSLRGRDLRGGRNPPPPPRPWDRQKSPALLGFISKQILSQWWPLFAVTIQSLTPCSTYLPIFQGHPVYTELFTYMYMYICISQSPKYTLIQVNWPRNWSQMWLHDICSHWWHYATVNPNPKPNSNHN